MPTYHPCLLIHGDSTEIDRILLGTYDTVEKTISATIYALVKRGLLDIELYRHRLQEQMPNDEAEKEWDELYELTRELDNTYDEEETYEVKEAHFLRHTQVYAEHLIKKTLPMDSTSDDLDAWRLKRLQDVLSEYGDIPLSCMGYVNAFHVEVEKKN